MAGDATWIGRLLRGRKQTLELQNRMLRVEGKNSNPLQDAAIRVHSTISWRGCRDGMGV